jgi:hypothetical protein
MNYDYYIEFAFKLSLFIALFLSFYIFIVNMYSKKNKYSHIFSTWQFPMLLALFLDAYLIES